MRHLRRVKKLGRTASHRHAMLANLATSVLDKGRVVTTLQKAKAARSVVERLITYAKKGGLSAIRQAAKTVGDKTVLKKLFDTIAPLYKDREGGYTRIVKLRERKGDRALLAIMELVNLKGDEQPRSARRKQTAKKPHEGPAKAPEAAQPQADAAVSTKKPKRKQAKKTSQQDEAAVEPQVAGSESSVTPEAAAAANEQQAKPPQDAAGETPAENK